MRGLAAVLALVSAFGLAACGSSDSAGGDEDANALTFTNDESRDVELSRCSPRSCGTPVWTTVLDPGSAKEDVLVSKQDGLTRFLVRAHVEEAPGEGVPIGCFEFRYRDQAEEETVPISESGPC